MRAYEPQFERLGALAERHFRDDPNACLIKLRQFAELLAQEVAARVGLYASSEESQSDLLRRLKVERAVPPPAMDLFHQIRMAGNKAAHAHADDHALALTTLRDCVERSLRNAIEHEPDCGNIDHGFRGLDPVLVVLGQAPIEPEPGETALDDPGQASDLEGALLTPDDL